MPRLIDLTGKKFGRLTVLNRLPAKNSKTIWLCSCDCGKLHESYAGNLNNGHTQSCGCLKDDTIANYKHGMNKTPEHKIWLGIKRRCLNKKSSDYKYYGEKGINIHAPWLDSFQLFFEHIGPRPSKLHSVDRIDNSLGYIPGNVRWATQTEQANNKCNNIKITFSNETKNAREWSEISGVNANTIGIRIKRGWTPEKSIFTKVKLRSES